MKRLEVRCCCDASKLLGSVEVPDKVLSGPITFPLSDGSRLDLEVSPIYGGSLQAALRSDGSILIAKVKEGLRLAVKNDDHPMEVLRKIPSFIELPEEMQRTTTVGKRRDALKLLGIPDAV